MKRFYIYLFAAFCTVFLGACTGNFRDMNDDLSGISDGDLEADDNGFGYRLQIVQQGIYFNYDFGKGKNWPFQMTQNLNADMFSGYMHDPKPLQGGSHNSDYNLQDGWNSAMWQFTYSYVMPQIYRLEQTAREKMPPFYAITKILKVLAMHRVTDYYGPVIYSHFADRGSEYVPDSQQQVYGCFFDDLDEAADILAAWVPLLYTGIISSGVGYTLQILGQRTVNPTVASLILSLESVFAVLAGWVLLGQPLSPRELVGCALVFAAVVLAQLPQKKPKVQSE